MLAELRGGAANESRAQAQHVIREREFGDSARHAAVMTGLAAAPRDGENHAVRVLGSWNLVGVLTKSAASDRAVAVALGNRLQLRQRDRQTPRHASGRCRARSAGRLTPSAPGAIPSRACSRDAGQPCSRAMGTARFPGTSSACKMRPASDAWRTHRPASRSATSRRRGQSRMSPFEIERSHLRT